MIIFYKLTNRMNHQQTWGLIFKMTCVLILCLYSLYYVYICHIVAEHGGLFADHPPSSTVSNLLCTGNMAPAFRKYYFALQTSLHSLRG